MSHVRNKVRWCLNKAKKEPKRHRGLLKVEFANYKGHIKKAEHNLNAAMLR